MYSEAAEAWFRFFLEQIANGNPITITDGRMSRYFMTIKDAVRLVLQASCLACQGEIYTLDMGEPLKITDLARRLTEMSGLDPDGDVTLETIGIRPGEKLHEQLWHVGLEISPTEFAGVYSVQPQDIPADYAETVAKLEQTAQNRDDGSVLQKLRSMPIGYSPEHKAIE